MERFRRIVFLCIPVNNGFCLSINGRSNARAHAEVLRDFRDMVLSTTLTGKMLTRLYYNHSDEIVEILTLDDELKIRVGDMVEALAPRASDIVSGRQTALTQGELKQMKDILVTLSERGSMTLRITMNFILDKIENESFLQQYGVKIVN